MWRAVEDALAIADPAACSNLLTEHDLLAAIVLHGRKAELTLLNGSCRCRQPCGGAAGALLCLERRDRPTGERARHVDDVLLCVTAVDAERVELEQFTGVVLVQAATARLWLRVVRIPAADARCASRHSFRGVRIGAQPVVEVEEHRRVLRRCAEQVAERPEHVGSDRSALVLGDPERRASFAGEHIKVVEPEVDELLLELALAIDDADHLLGAQRLDRLAAPLPRRHHVVYPGGTQRLPGQTRLQRAIVNRLWTELLLDPGRQTDPCHAIDFARPRTVGEPVECVLGGRSVFRNAGRPCRAPGDDKSQDQ
jgi:hypothetical protein